MPVNFLTSNVVKGSGLVARGYSKVTVDPIDVAGAVQDAVQGFTMMFGKENVDVKNVGAVNPADILQCSGLVARGYSRLVLDPVDVQSAVKDFVQASVLIGVSFKAGPFASEDEQVREITALLRPAPTA